MAKTLVKALILAIASALMFGCAAQQQPMPTFMAQDLNPMLKSGGYVQKTDSFMVVFDASGSMDHGKIKTAKDIVRHMDQTIPEIKLTAGLRRFGEGHYVSGSPTALLYGITDYAKGGLEGGLQKIPQGNGGSPLNLAIDAASEELKTAPGNVALIIVSDGMEMGNAPVMSAMKMKDAYGDRLCIYTILVGDSPEGKSILEQVAVAGKCGFATNAASVTSDAGMADFVNKVFLAKVVKPVEPPKPVAPPPAPKPKDSDGDGVYDDADRCPRTPMGAPVNAEGCWVIRNVEFDTDKWGIKPVFQPELNTVADIMKKNPWLNLGLQGHTDNRGTVKYNQILSEKRASAVMDYLVNQGISSDRLSTEGFGFTKPIASNSTREGMDRNRRTEINIVP